jgi:hypothetical protein
VWIYILEQNTESCSSRTIEPFKNHTNPIYPDHNSNLGYFLFLHKQDTMHTSLLASLLHTIVTVSLWQVASAAPRPAALQQLSYVPAGSCRTVGQFICVSDTTFAICNSALQGVVQALAVGDIQCRQVHQAATTTTPAPLPAVTETVFASTGDAIITVTLHPTPRPSDDGLTVIPVTLTKRSTHPSPI